MSSDTGGRPVQVFLDTRQFIRRQDPRQGGGNKDFFDGDDQGFQRHKRQIQQKIQDAAGILRRNNHEAGFVIVQMRQEALAKSYRPITALFSRSNNFGLAGAGRIGEMYFQCTPGNLERLYKIVEDRAEPTPRLKKNEKTGNLERRPSNCRSELSGIEDIRLPGPAEKIAFSAREAVDWLARPDTLGGYLVALFRPDLRVEPRQVTAMVENFRSRISGFGGVIAFPMGLGRRQQGQLISPVLSIDLAQRGEPELVVLPDFGDEEAGSNHPVISLGEHRRDLSAQRNQELLELLYSEPLVRRIELAPAVEVTPAGEARPGPEASIPHPTPGGSYPVVGVIDGGIAKCVRLMRGEPGSRLLSPKTTGTTGMEPSSRA